MPDFVEIEEQAEQQSLQDRYVVHLSVFEGPLDLLLHLIEKRQMEITTISLLAVTDQYLAYLQQWRSELLPLANMASFISIAARLLFIKSQYLLPHAPKEMEDGTGDSAIAMAEELQHHLVEYKLAKEIAQALRQREEAGLQTHGRSGLLAGIEAQLNWTPPKLTGLELSSLACAFQRLLELQARDKANGDGLVPVAHVRVSERIAKIISHLQACPSILLSQILKNEHSRIIIVVTFIAVLELWKWDRIDVRQQELLGPIMLERGTRWAEASEEEVEEI